MAKYLIRTVETFRVDSEDEAKRFVEEQRQDNRYTLAKQSIEYRERKVKGEVEDSWYRVTLTKVFNEEKNPIDIYVENTEDDLK